MPAERRIVAAKVFAMLGFLVLLPVTYWLRSEVLGLSRIRFSADERQVRLQQQRDRDAFPDRQEQYEIQLKNYDTQLKHYEKMIEVYQRDLQQYAKLTQDQLQPPLLPIRPEPPN